MANKCKECGCICKQCNNYEQKHNDMHLHVEIENLRQRLAEKDNHIVTMETHFLNEAEKFPNGELASLKEEMLIWQDKYTRLCEAHKRVQKVNQNLEDKLLRIVDKCETEKGAFTKDIATLSHRLAEANYTIHRLTQDNEKYRNDVNLAIQLLQCKPSNFVGQKYESLPPEVQAKVRSYVAQKGYNNEMPNTEVKSITVPISTFPPTAMVYNIAKTVDKYDKQNMHSDEESKPPVDTVSAAIMAKVLEDREKERIFARHCITCTCHRSVLKIDSETQTTQSERGEDSLNSTRDYFNRSESKRVKIIKESCQPGVKEKSLNYGKGHSSNEPNSKRDGYHSVNEIDTKKLCTNGEDSKSSGWVNSDAKNYLNLKSKNSIRNKSTRDETNLSDKSKSILHGDRVDAQMSLNKGEKWTDEKKSSKDTKNFDDQAKLDIINERLWKSSWQNSKSSLSAKESDVQLDVINERVWRKNNNGSNSVDKPSRMTVIEIKNPDELTSQSEKTQTSEATTSPSFSSDSILISSSDPSSLSSDVVFNQNAKKETQRVNPGPRNCLMRVSPGSKNILLDNVSAYETVLYTSGCSKPNTALVHLGKSTRSSGSGRSASISSEENVTSSSNNSHLQRVAQWVDTISARDQLLDNSSSEDPLISANFKAQDQRDLMTFEGSSDEEHRLTLDYVGQANISKEMEETYAKLAASLETTSLTMANQVKLDMMTVEEYRKEQKRLHRSSLTDYQSRT